MRREDINYCPRCGVSVEIIWKFGRERPVCPDCDWVFFPDPKVAVAVFVEKNEKVLLVQRGSQPQRGLWALPAGFVDAGENPSHAAERECLEETGLQVRVTGLIDVLAGDDQCPGSADMIIIYRAEANGGQLCAGDDAQQALFFERCNLPPLAFKATHKVLKQ